MQFDLVAPISTMAQKNGLREQIERDTARFLASGGKIQQIQTGEPSTFTWDGDWLDHAAAAKYLGVPLAQLKNSVMNGTLCSCAGPVSYIRGGRRMWPQCVLDAWLSKYGNHVKNKTRAFKEGKKGEVAA